MRQVVLLPAVAIVAGALMLASMPAQAGSYVFTTIGPAGYTTITGLNDRDEVVGYIHEPNSDAKGFIYSHGQYTYVANPSSSVTLAAVNANGVAVGLSTPDDGQKPATSFVYRPFYKAQIPLKDGLNAVAVNASRDVVGLAGANVAVRIHYRYGTLNPPGASVAFGQAINDNDVVLGSYFVGDPGMSNEHGFTYTGKADGTGKYVSFDPPSAVTTYPTTITNDGTIVGTYCLSIFCVDGRENGFVLKNGAYTVISFPGATSTSASGILPSGEVAGSFIDPTTTLQHGFVLLGGTYHQIDAPQGTMGTFLGAINASGSIVGQYGIQMPGSQYSVSVAFIATCPKSHAPCTK